MGQERVRDVNERLEFCGRLKYFTEEMERLFTPRIEDDNVVAWCDGVLAATGKNVTVLPQKDGSFKVSEDGDDRFVTCETWRDVRFLFVHKATHALDPEAAVAIRPEISSGVYS